MHYVYITLGSISVVLGIIGIFLPIMPTTIFLIIASYFFMKGSPALNEKLLSNKYLGVYIRNYREEKGMPLKSKINAILLLWASILTSAIFFVDNLIIKILLIVIAIGVTIYLLSLKTIKSDK